MKIQGIKLAKYHNAKPFTYYCRSCEVEFNQNDLKQSFFTLGKGRCPRCESSNDVFTIQSRYEVEREYRVR